jgi:hypothetical protein
VHPNAYEVGRMRARALRYATRHDFDPSLLTLAASSRPGGATPHDATRRGSHGVSK